LVATHSGSANPSCGTALADGWCRPEIRALSERPGDINHRHEAFLFARQLMCPLAPDTKHQRLINQVLRVLLRTSSSGPCEEARGGSERKLLESQYRGDPVISTRGIGQGRQGGQRHNGFVSFFVLPCRCFGLAMSHRRVLCSGAFSVCRNLAIGIEVVGLVGIQPVR
jgi:hypothetical protein